MGRSKWKLNFSDLNLKKQNIKKIWSRDSVINSGLIDKAVSIHNGKEFKDLLITREKIGFKFGEFINTRRHTNKQKEVKTPIKDKKKVIKKT